MLTCADEALLAVLQEIAVCMGVQTSKEAVALLYAMMQEMELDGPAAEQREPELDRLAGGVNVERLGNHPVPLSADVLYTLYEQIVK